jgi:hypothetical protein
VTGALQSDQQFLDLVELDMVAGEPSYMVGKRVALRLQIRHVMTLGQVPNDFCGSALLPG